LTGPQHDPRPRRILITGAAGKIGAILREGLRARFDLLRLLDIAPLGPARPGEELVTADIRDMAAVTEAMVDIDAVVHLAGIADEDTFDHILKTNIVGTYQVFETARRRGCKRLVFASSAHVTGFYPTDQHIGPEVPLRPDSYYGVGKAFGENLGRLYADKHGLQVVCVRIGTAAERPTSLRHLSTWLSPRDTVELFYCCLVAPQVRFTVVYGVSANPRSWWDTTSAERLDYRPLDSAERWASEIDPSTEDPAESGSGLQGGKYASFEVDDGR
jgi:uronate dehydrogenase